MDNKLKLIKNDQLNEKEKELYDNIMKYRALFDMLRLQSKNTYDKNYMIMAYNLFDIGMSTEAILTINKVTPGYYANHLMKDIQFSVDQKNKAEEYKNNPKKIKEYKSCIHEFEFFLVSLELPKYLLNVENHVNKKEYEEFVSGQMSGSTYKFINKPKIESV